MLDSLLKMLSYGFMTRALAVGFLLALAAALPGMSLVLRRTAMSKNGLPQVSFGALAVATALNPLPLAAAVPLALAAAFLLLRLRDSLKKDGEAAVSLSALSALALGVIIMILSGGGHTDVYRYLFGSMLSLRPLEASFTALLSGAVLLCGVLFYHRIFAVTFDEPFFRAVGMRAEHITTLLAMMTVAVLVLGLRTAGLLPVAGLLILPALTAARVCRSFIGMTLCTASIAAFSVLAGLMISYYMQLPSGASILGVLLAAFLLLAPFSLAFHRN